MQDWLEAVRTLVRDPSSNFAALGTAIAIAVIVIIIGVLLMVAFVLPQGHAEHSPAGTVADKAAAAQRRARRRGAWATGVVIVAFGLLAAAAAWYQTTSSNEYCTRTCHSMARAVETWQASPHAGVACVRCHEGTQWKTVLAGTFQRAACIYYEVSGRRAPRRKVPSANCLSCHDGLLDQPLAARNGEQFTHRDIVDDKTDCASCHGPQGHQPSR